MIFRTASTAIGDKSSQLEETTFELREVLTQSIKVSRWVISTGIEREFLMTPSEKSKAFWKPSWYHEYLRRLCLGECPYRGGIRQLSGKRQLGPQQKWFHLQLRHLELWIFPPTKSKGKYHFGGRVDYIKFLKNSGSIISDKGLSSAIFDHFVHSSGTKTCANAISHS